MRAKLASVKGSNSWASLSTVDLSVGILARAGTHTMTRSLMIHAAYYHVSSDLRDPGFWALLGHKPTFSGDGQSVDAEPHQTLFESSNYSGNPSWRQAAAKLLNTVCSSSAPRSPRMVKVGSSCNTSRAADFASAVSPCRSNAAAK